ncbi:MAG: DnaJ domain-containing protein [Bacteroidia bacterium]
MKKNYYQILGLDRNASQDEIRKAYRYYASKFHPDLHNGDKFFEGQFLNVKEAYDLLSDPIKRRKYDSEFFDLRESTFQESEAPVSQSEQKGKTERPENTASHSSSSSNFPKAPVANEKVSQRQKNFLIGVGTAFSCYALFALFGDNGWHVPLAMGFFFWTIRQAFVLVVSYIPD